MDLNPYIDDFMSMDMDEERQKRRDLAREYVSLAFTCALKPAQEKVGERGYQYYFIIYL